MCCGGPETGYVLNRVVGTLAWAVLEDEGILQSGHANYYLHWDTSPTLIEANSVDPSSILICNMRTRKTSPPNY